MSTFPNKIFVEVMDAGNFTKKIMVTKTAEMH
jgi:hypothetical protein